MSKEETIKERLKVIETKLDLLLNKVDKEVESGDREHKELREKVSKLDKVQYGVLVTVGLLATSCATIAKKVFGF